MSRRISTNKDEKVPNSASIIYSDLNNPDSFINSLATAYKNKRIDDEYIVSLAGVLNRNTYAKLLNLILDKDNPVLITKGNNSSLGKKKPTTKYRKKNIRKKTNFYMSITKDIRAHLRARQDHGYVLLLAIHDRVKV